MKLKQYKLDFYATLGINSDATQDEIKQAYIKLAKELHPDRNQHLTQRKRKSLEDKMYGINEAFSILSNPTKRREYDYSMHLEQCTLYGNDFLRGIEEEWIPKSSYLIRETRLMKSLDILVNVVYGICVVTALALVASGLYDLSQIVSKQQHATIQKQNQHKNSGQLENEAPNRGRASGYLSKI